jgi:hypothetical protein
LSKSQMTKVLLKVKNYKQDWKKVDNIESRYIPRLIGS